MGNYTAVCGGRTYLEISVRDLSDRWKSLESESAMMFPPPLMCWKYNDTSLLMRFHTSHLENMYMRFLFNWVK